MQNDVLQPQLRNRPIGPVNSTFIDGQARLCEEGAWPLGQVSELIDILLK